MQGGLLRFEDRKEKQFMLENYWGYYTATRIFCKATSIHFIINICHE